jgi:hypothetical protein
MVHMSWKNDRFGDHRRNNVGLAYWPTAFPWGVEIALVTRKVTAHHNAIARWSSQLLGKRVRVSPMSRRWLRTHEAEHGKRGADV